MTMQSKSDFSTPVYRTDPPHRQVGVRGLLGEVCAVRDESVAETSRLAALLASRPIVHRRLCLIVPPLLAPEAINPLAASSRNGPLCIPYGFLLLAAVARMTNPAWSVTIIDLQLEALRRKQKGHPHSMADLCALIPDDCDAYGVTWTFKSTEDLVVQLLDYLMGKEFFVWCGGVEATFSHEKLSKEKRAHIIFRHEAEMQLYRVLSLWDSVCGKRGTEPFASGFVNLSFIDDKGIVNFPDCAERLVVPSVLQEYGLIDFDQYHQAGGPTVWWRTDGDGKKYATIQATRGCRGHCTFCTTSEFYGRGVRGRAPSDVVEEIEYLYREKGVRHIAWVDDDLLADRSRSFELFNGIRDLGHKDLTWSTQNGVMAGSIDEPITEVMAESGCVMLAFGIETGDPERLKQSRKPTTHAIIRRACEIVKQHQDITLAGFFIVGFPMETLAGMMGTLSFARSLGLDWCRLASLLTLSGTTMFAEHGADADGKRIFSPGQSILAKGKTFDDYFTSIDNFETMDPETLLSIDQISQFQLYFDIHVNMLGNRNLRPGGRPDKILRHCRNMSEVYPMNPSLWATQAMACHLLGRDDEAKQLRKRARQALDDSTFWQEFYKLHRLYEPFGIPV